MFPLDFGEIDSFISARSFGRSGFVLSSFDLAHLGFFLLTRGFAGVGLSLPMPGIARTEFVFFLPVTDKAYMGLLLLLRSPSRMDSVLPVVDYSVSGPSASLHSFGHPGLCSLLLNFAHPGPSMLLHHVASAGPTLLAFGATCSGSCMSALDAVTLGLVVSLRSFVCPGFALLLFDCAQPGFPPFARQYTRLEFAASTLGLSRVEPVFSLSVIDASWGGSSLSLRSFARSESALLAFDFLHMDSVLLMQSFVRFDSLPLCFGLARVGSVFSLSVIEETLFGPSPLTRSFACPESVVLLVDFMGADFALLSHEFG